MEIYCLAETREPLTPWSIFRLHDNKWRWICAKDSFRYQKLVEQGHHFFLPTRIFEYNGVYSVGSPALSEDFVEGDLS